MKKISALIPEGGGGLSMEVSLVEEENGEKYVLRACSLREKAENYEFISNKLSKYKVLPKFIKREGNNVFYEYLQGRDLTHNENLEIFEEIGVICARINDIEHRQDVDINLHFNKQLDQLVTGRYQQFTAEEMIQKRARRPNEEHDDKRIKALISKTEKEKIVKINNMLIVKIRPKVTWDAFDVSPANFRLSDGKVYFVDIDAIKPKMAGMGMAKCFYGWAKTDAQRESFIKGYCSVLKSISFGEEYMDLLNLHFLIQALHDRAKLGREYKGQFEKLKEILKRY